jgi:calmodulin-regulated spectrin-associated protein
MSTWSQQMQQQQQHQQMQQQQQQQNKYDTLPSWKTSSPIQQQQQQPHQQQQSQTPPQLQKSSGFMLHKQNGRDSHNEAQRLFPVVHATTPKTNQEPSDEMMMAPQSISFIADEDDYDEGDNSGYHPIPRKNGSSIKKSFDKIDEFEASLGKLNITSGSRTYRIPSPTTRHGLGESSFQSMESQNENEKGFYISFDNETQPKRPKPPLRAKKSPKKSADDSIDNSHNQFDDNQEVFSRRVFNSSMQENGGNNNSNGNLSMMMEPIMKPKVIEHNMKPAPRLSSAPKEGAALVIEDDKNHDPVS